jgi:lipopolysaccharide export system protein LptC
MAEKRMFPVSEMYAHWHPRETIRQALRYSRFVKVMKALLPLAALGVGAAVLLFALQPRQGERYSLSFERIGTVENDLAMLNPTLTGVDDDGLPFVVRAGSAVQDPDSVQRVHLKNVRAMLTLKDGAAVNVTAAQGLVDNIEQKLSVSGGIHFSSDAGYTAETEAAHADLKTGILESEGRVTAQGAFGRVTANKFIFEKNTRRMHFQGDVRMDLNGASAP